MFEGTLVDLVPFEGDYATYLETWMNEEAWFRAHFFDRREPHTETDVKKFIEKMEKNDHAGLIGFQSKAGDPIGVLIYDHEWGRVRKIDANIVVGDMRYEGTDEAFDGLLMLLRYLFETRNMHRVETGALAFDEMRIELLRRAGFMHEGSLREHVRWAGDYVDVELFGLLQDEWPGYASIVADAGLEASDIEPKPKPEKKDEKSEPSNGDA